MAGEASVPQLVPSDYFLALCCLKVLRVKLAGEASFVGLGPFKQSSYDQISHLRGGLFGDPCLQLDSEFMALLISIWVFTV